MAFSVGQKVVCIDATGQRAPSYLTKDAAYTVRWYGQRETDAVPCIMLSEIRAPWNGHPSIEWAFNATRFRPLTDTKSSISFTEGAPRSTRHLDNRRKLPAKVSS